MEDLILTEFFLTSSHVICASVGVRVIRMAASTGSRASSVSMEHQRDLVTSNVVGGGHVEGGEM